jgi:hypothetical protein
MSEGIPWCSIMDSPPIFYVSRMGLLLVEQKDVARLFSNKFTGIVVSAV